MTRAEYVRGFSLIELLVVIAIIAMLVALTIPSLKTARQVSLQTSCAARVRAWSVVLLAYTVDNRGAFPRRAGGILQIPGAEWERLTNPYIDGGLPVNLNKAPAYYFCSESIIPASLRDQWSNINGRAMEFGIYASQYPPIGLFAPKSPLRAEDAYDQFNQPRVLLGDVNRWQTPVTNYQTGSPIHTVHADGRFARIPFSSAAMPGFVYENGIPRGLNVGHVDGSVKWIRWDRVDLTKYTTPSGNLYTYMWEK